MRTLLLLLLACSPLLAADKPSIHWVKLVDAYGKAASERKNVLFRISHPPDGILKAAEGTDLWHAPDVVAVVNETFVAVEMDLENDMAPRRSYHVQSAPTILVLDSAAKVQMHMEKPAFRDTAAFVKWLKAIDPALEQLGAVENKFDESGGKSAKLADMLAGLYEKLGRPKDAAKVCRRYAETLANDQPDCATAWLRAASLYLKADALDDAQAAIDKVDKLLKEDDKRRVELRIAKATLLSGRGKYDEAGTAFRKLYDELLKAGDARAYDASAHILQTAQEKDASDKAYKAASKAHHERCLEVVASLKDDPRVYEIRYAGAISAYEAGDRKAARKEMTALAKEKTDNPYVARARHAVAAWGK